VLERNPALDEVIAYTKLKHLVAGQSAFGAIVSRLASFSKLRRLRLDYVVLATSDFVPRMLQLARWLAPRQIVGFSDGSVAASALDLSVPIAKISGLHEVERVFALAPLFGIEGEIPPLTVIPDRLEAEKANSGFVTTPGNLKVAVHISARRPAQRWPAERFAALIKHLHAAHGARVMLLWSPGPGDHPRHPGDDDKAKEIQERLDGRVPLLAYGTKRLQELIGALAACDAVICSDGGAMHIAAALGKPIVALFGDSAPERWRPWGSRHVVVRAPSRLVADIGEEEVWNAASALMARA
jgi:ADP-heptose:LPS heptosyltransferase